jgi:hypothetical protein
MSETAIQTAANPALPPLAPGVELPGVRAPRTKGKWAWLMKPLTIAASLRITVVLFFLAILLIFFGTLAQVDEGILTVVHKYFRCFIAWIPLRIFFSRSGSIVPGRFPFPGGWMIAGLLLINVLAAHATRFRLTWKRSGVLILHAGLIIMIAGEFITGLFAVETRMAIVAGQSADYVFSIEAVELAFIRPNSDGTEHVISIPDSRLKKDREITDTDLPFVVEVVKFMPNSESPRHPKDDFDNPATAGLGRYRMCRELPERGGTGTESSIDMPSAYISLHDPKTGAVSGTYLFSTHFSDTGEPQTVEWGDKHYEVELRFKRTYKPYTVYLQSVKTEFYENTQMPKSYTSRIRLVDPQFGVDRDATITMNEPLRYRGETFYQAGAPEGNMVTVLQVVRNPGWLLPYVSCVTVGVGMLVHFGILLIGFLRRRVATA